MYAELLELQSLDDLIDLICIGPVPKGRRVLVLSLSGHPNCAWLRASPASLRPRGLGPRFDRKLLVNSAYQFSDNTVALARKTGKPIGHFRSSLPPGSVIDCVLDREQHVLWVLDILTWSWMPVSDSEASFRCVTLGRSR